MIKQNTIMAMNIAVQLYSGTEIDINDFIYSVGMIEEFLNKKQQENGAETQPTQEIAGTTQTNS